MKIRGDGEGGKERIEGGNPSIKGEQQKPRGRKGKRGEKKGRLRCGRGGRVKKKEN